MKEEFDAWALISQVVEKMSDLAELCDRNELNADSMISMRAEIRHKIHEVREYLCEKFNLKVSKYISFGLTVWMDEKIANLSDKMDTTMAWPPLQQELYETREGGAEIYEYMDDVLQNTFFPGIVYQFYYAMLKDGFKGRYIIDHDYRLQKYLAQFEEVMEVDAYNQAKAKQAAPKENNVNASDQGVFKYIRKGMKFFKTHLYLNCVLSLIVLYLIVAGFLYI